jgi:hypothetical protein
MTADSTGATIVSGDFDGTIDLGAGIVGSAGQLDIFVAKLTASGTLGYSGTFGDAAPQHTDGVAVDGSDNIVIAGKTAGTIDFGGGALLAGSLYMAKLDPNGNHLASTSFGSGFGASGSTHVAVDAFNNIVVFEDHNGGALDFGGGALPISGMSDVALAKLDSTLMHLWSFGFSSGGNAYGFDLALGADGTIGVAGLFAGALTPGPNNFTAQDTDAFVALFAP